MRRRVRILLAGTLIAGLAGTGAMRADGPGLVAGGETPWQNDQKLSSSFLEDLAEIAPGLDLVVAGNGTVGSIDLKGSC